MNDPAFEKQEIVIPSFRVQQKIGEFYIACLPGRLLVDICKADVRAIVDEDRLEFSGFQREVKPSRTKAIVQYLRNVDATFPTSVIVSVDDRCVDVAFNKDCGTYTITLAPWQSDEENVPFDSIATILDGQHRIEALRQYYAMIDELPVDELDDADRKEFFINVSFFIGADPATKATIFSVVNMAQTRVNHSLVYDLLSYEKYRSPEKSCHQIAVAMNNMKGSPFHRRIKRLGVATFADSEETLAQATFVRGLLRTVTRDAVEDRIMISKGKRLRSVTDIEDRKHVFRREFIEAEEAAILDQVWEYYDAVRDRWPAAWNAKPSEGLVLNRTTGYIALARFLPDALNYFREQTGERFVKKELFSSLFDRSIRESAEFETNNFKPGSSGSSEFYHELKALIPTG